MKYNIILLIVLILYTSYNLPQEDPMYNKQGKPSSWGIATFIENNQNDIINEYELLVNDTIYDVYIFTDNLSEVNDGLSLGEFYIPDQIIITNQEKYIAYEWKDLTKYQQRVYPYITRTVKAVIFHELTHAYFYQNIYILQKEGKEVSPEYGLVRLFPNSSSRFGSTFIEEGVCEYAVYSLKESAPLGKIKIPTSVEQILDKQQQTDILYYYSVYFLKDFLDTYGLKKGIRILLQNKPPTYEEILKPDIFFERLIIK